MIAFDHGSVLLIGSGRLAQHLRYWNSLLPNPNSLLCWDRSQGIEQLHLLIKKSSLVWLAISDSALVPFYEEHLTELKKPVVHFSGALFDVRIPSAHPLMSFPRALLDAPTYPKIHFALSGAATLHELMPGFTNSFSIMPEKDKALYHALCVMSGNFPQLLWSETFPQLSQLEIPEAAINLYLTQITENFIKYRSNALTGPLIRRDQNTIEKNLRALTDSKLKKVYQSFVEEFTK